MVHVSKDNTGSIEQSDKIKQIISNCEFCLEAFCVLHSFDHSENSCYLKLKGLRRLSFCMIPISHLQNNELDT